MAITLVWHDPEHTILHHVYTSDWTLTEFSISFDEMCALCEGEDHRVHNIIDVTQSHLIPRGNMIGQIRNRGHKVPANVASVCIVGDSFILHLISRTFNAMPGNRVNAQYAFNICTSFKDASQWIASLEKQEE